MKLKHIILYSIAFTGFTLGISRGYLALWQDGQPEPLQIYSLPATSLPEADQALLRNGIKAETVAELTSLLEDFLS